MTTSDVVLNVNPLPLTLHSPPSPKVLTCMHWLTIHVTHKLTRTRTRAHMCLQNAGQSSARQRRAFSWCALVSLKQVQRARACSTSAVKHGGCGPRGTNAPSLEHCMACVSVQPLSRPPAAVVCMLSQLPRVGSVRCVRTCSGVCITHLDNNGFVAPVVVVEPACVDRFMLDGRCM